MTGTKEKTKHKTNTRDARDDRIRKSMTSIEDMGDIEEKQAIEIIDRE